MDWDLPATNDDSAPTPASDLVVVYDATQECPYLDGRVARMPLEFPRRALTPTDVDQLLELGYRRTGNMFYRTNCPSCRECIPTRVDVNVFQETRSMRRVLNRAHRELEIELGVPQVDYRRVELFNEHRDHRELSRHGEASESDYREFLVSTCIETIEMSFKKDGRLTGVAILDVGARSLNAVYTYFATSAQPYSIGTLAILKQMELARRTDRQFVYLGLYVEDNAHLNYKARFRPQQRLIEGTWREV